MAEREDSSTQLKVDVGVLKEQVNTITTLCNKMDVVIEKLVEQHNRHIEKVYVEMDNRRLETEADIREIHDRVDTVLDKLQATELRLMTEIKNLNESIKKNNAEEKEKIDSLLQWKWTIVGGLIVISWILSKVDLATLHKILFSH